MENVLKSAIADVDQKLKRDISPILYKKLIQVRGLLLQDLTSWIF
jgi:hypothetical protein